MSDEEKIITLNQTVITDDEAQFSGDVETPFLELVYLATAPTPTTDKGSVLMYAMAADGSARMRLQSGVEINVSDCLLNPGRSQMDSRQGAAATETIRTFRAIAPGTIIGVTAEDGVVAAAAESMTVDVKIAGVSCLVAPITLDNAVPIDTPVAGVLAPAAVAFAAGDLVTVVRTYVPGGAPTPMSATVCDIEVQFD